MVQIIPGPHFQTLCQIWCKSVQKWPSYRLRRHYRLQHRYTYRCYGPPIYISDDEEYARICTKARRNQCHRRTAARQRSMATGAEPQQHVPRPSAAPPDVHQPRRRCQSQPQVAAGALTGSDRLPVAGRPPDRATSGCAKSRAGPTKKGSPPTPRLERPSSEGINFDQFVRVTRYTAEMRAYDKQCARDRRMREEQSSSDSDSYDFKRPQRQSPPETRSQSAVLSSLPMDGQIRPLFKVGGRARPEVMQSFHVASRDVEPADDDVVLAANLPMARTIYQPGTGRSVLHLDDIGSQFR